MSDSWMSHLAGITLIFRVIVVSILFSIITIIITTIIATGIILESINIWVFLDLLLHRSKLAPRCLEVFDAEQGLTASFKQEMLALLVTQANCCNPSVRVAS